MEAIEDGNSQDGRMREKENEGTKRRRASGAQCSSEWH